MCRLAVGIEPPGGFWEKPRNLNQTVPKMDEKHTIPIKQRTVWVSRLKIRKDNSPYLDSLLQIRICVLLSNPISSLPLVSLPQRFTLNFLAPHNPNFSGKTMPNSHTKNGSAPFSLKVNSPLITT